MKKLFITKNGKELYRYQKIDFLFMLVWGVIFLGIISLAIEGRGFRFGVEGLLTLVLIVVCIINFFLVSKSINLNLDNKDLVVNYKYFWLFSSQRVKFELGGVMWSMYPSRFEEFKDKIKDEIEFNRV